MKKMIKGVCEFLKYSFITHLDDDSTDPFHDTKYALGHRDYNEYQRKGECTECNAVFKFLKEVKLEIIDRSETLDRILLNAGKKLETFMGHTVKKHVQEKRNITHVRLDSCRRSEPSCIRIY